MSKSNPMHSDAWDRSAIDQYFKRYHTSSFHSCSTCEHCGNERRPLYDSRSQDEDDIRGWYPVKVCRLLGLDGTVTKSMCPGLEVEVFLEDQNEQ